MIIKFFGREGFGSVGSSRIVFISGCSRQLSSTRIAYLHDSKWKARLRFQH